MGTPYEIALYSGSIGIAGTLIGTIVTYWFALQIAEKNAEYSRTLAAHNALRVAGAQLRAAFAPALAILYVARHHGTHDKPPVDAKFKNWLLEHGAAVENFRPFVPVGKSDTYQQAWEEYRKAAAQSHFDTTAEEWGLNLAEGVLLEKSIETVLSFTEFKSTGTGWQTRMNEALLEWVAKRTSR